ncbi:hypothetical protein KP509_03G046500 [Ceratopteris richardii]|nr:hypothetical protein KP509_03G046500 [Ceratopteris richardii]
MQHIHFEVNQSDSRIAQLLSQNSTSLQSNPELQTDLLFNLARSVGIEDASQNSTALKLQVELLKNDLQGATEAYDLQMMDLLGNLVENWASGADSINTSAGTTSGYHEQRRVEPLYESFVCPLTKTVMRDPVTVESGWTYERSAIEKWFWECKSNGRPATCPATGKELHSTAVKPSIALRQTIEEWTARNEHARIENAKILLTSRSSQQDMLHGLKDVQVLCTKNKLNKHKLRKAGLIPEIVNCLKHGEQVRCTALATLRCLAEGEDENKVNNFV